MRLIDADALADALFEKRKNYPQWVANTIGEMPDAVVRCKDCIYAEPFFESYKCYFDEENEYGCRRSHDADSFCSYGERKEGR